MKSYDTAWATTLIQQYLAPDGYAVSLQNCRVIARFPADGLNPHTAFKFGVQPLDDEIDAPALVGYVARRRNKQTKNLFGQENSPRRPI
jgi:hypothetical protein